MPRIMTALIAGLAALIWTAPAAQAADWGLISRVVEDDDLAGEGLELATRLAEGPTVAYGLLRRLANGPEEKNIVHKAIEEAATNAGAPFSVENGVMVLDLD